MDSDRDPRAIYSVVGDPWGGLGFRVWGLGFRVWGLGFRVYGLGFGVQDMVFGSIHQRL